MNDINSRVARMIGYAVENDGHAFPTWRDPSGSLVYPLATLPNFEHSLDSCREVLEWIAAERKDYIFINQLFYEIESQLPWEVLNATPQHICLAALAVGERKS